MIFTGHEHSYERTHLMKNFETQQVKSKSSVLKVKPGASFSAVTGLGGESIRPWIESAQFNPWWASTVSATVMENLKIESSQLWSSTLRLEYT